MLILCVMCALALFLPAVKSQPFIVSHVFWLWTGFVFTGLYLMFTGIHEGGKKVVVPLQNRRKQKRMEDVLANLPQDEFQILLLYIKENKTSVDFISGRMQGALLDLVTKGILVQGMGYLNGYTAMNSYDITPEANSCVRKPIIREAFLNREISK